MTLFVNGAFWVNSACMHNDGIRLSKKNKKTCMHWILNYMLPCITDERTTHVPHCKLVQVYTQRHFLAIRRYMSRREASMDTHAWPIYFCAVHA